MRIILDPGHGGRDPGAIFNGKKEKDITLAVAKKIYWMMADSEVYLTRTDDRFVFLKDRCKFANDLHADYFLSIHCNADSDIDGIGMPEAKGEELWIYNNSIKGLKYAEKLKKYIDMIFIDEPFRGIKKTKNLYVLKYTIAPAGLVEIGFIDNSQTWRHFQDSSVITEIACCLTLGLLRI